MRRQDPPGASVGAIAFDFDGVLCHSVAVKSHAFAALYQDAGPEIVEAVLAYHHAHGGIDRHRKIAYFEGVLLGVPPDPTALAAKAQRFADLVVRAVIEAPLVPGTEEALRRHAGRRPLFVVSGTPQEELRHIVRAKGLSPFFDAVLGSPRQKADHLRDILDQSGIAADRLVMVGDALTDFTAAAEVGARFVGVAPAPGLPPAGFPGAVPVIPDLSTLDSALTRAPLAEAPAPQALAGFSDAPR